MSFFVDIHSHSNKEKKDCIVINSLLSSDFDKFSDEGESLFSVGIHPWEINQNSFDLLRKLDFLAFKENVLAIGETGLDKVCKTDFELQCEIFVRHLEIAEKTHKPVIIHCVKAWDEIYKEISEFPSLTYIFHSFSGNDVILRQFLKFDSYFSFGKNILRGDKNSGKAIIACPQNRLFAETDDSDFEIEKVYLEMSSKISLDEVELKKIIFNNFDRIFKIKK